MARGFKGNAALSGVEMLRAAEAALKGGRTTGNNRKPCEGPRKRFLGN
jgi:hypothetical protein